LTEFEAALAARPDFQAARESAEKVRAELE
jgi:hypothetical protein